MQHQGANPTEIRETGRTAIFSGGLSLLKLYSIIIDLSPR